MRDSLTLPQALFLLARDDATGKPVGNYNRYIQPAGALTELMMIDRLKLRQGKKAIIDVQDTAPTGSAYLDAVLSQIAASAKSRSMQHWVTRLAGRRGRVDLIGQELVSKGIIEKVPTKFLGIFPVTRWRPLRTSIKTSLKGQMSKVLFTETAKPDEWTGSIIALASSGHLLKRNFDRSQLRAYKKHIKSIVRGEWASASAATDAVKAAKAAITAIMAAAAIGVSS